MSAVVPADEHDAELLAGQRPEAAAAPVRVRGRALAIALSVVAGVVATVFLASHGKSAAVHEGAPIDGDLQLYGQHQQCSTCPGGQCNCDWVNAQTCAPAANTGDCCWNCCCASGNLASLAAKLPLASHAARLPAPPPAQLPAYSDGSAVVESDGCSLATGQAVHVTGNSGREYTGTVLAQTGSGLFEVGIFDESYTVSSDYIAECGQPWWANFWGFWVPFFLIVLLIGALVGLAFFLWRTMKQ